MTDIKKELLHGLTETFKEADESEKDYLNEKVSYIIFHRLLFNHGVQFCESR